ncbi:MAG TPA: glycosyltransferase family 39 protein [bacterium]|nr:glycosyltransferase family 39 protein [bacterium]
MTSRCRGPGSDRLWTLAAISLILAHTGWQMWQVALAPYPAQYDYDEGVYAETAAAAAGGVPLYTGVFLSQPPLLILALSAAYRATMPSLAAARDTVAVFSALWLLALFLVLAGDGRPRAGVLAILAVLGNPAFLTSAHTVQMEAPSEALAAAAVALAVQGLRRSGMLWWTAAGALWGLATMTKLTAAVSIVPLVGAVLAGTPRPGPSPAWGRRAGALVAGVILALTPFLPTISIKPFLAQALFFHVALARHLGPDPAGHALSTLRFLGAGWPLSIAAGLGVGLALMEGGALARLLVAWLAAALAAVLALTPLWPHHLVLLLSPLALLAGISLDRLVDRVTGVARGAAATAGIAAVAAYWVAGVSAGGAAAPSRDLREMSGRIAAALPRTAYMVTDDPLVAFLAGRSIPPEVIDTSIARFLAGELSERTLWAALRSDRVQAVLFWRGTFQREFPGLASRAAAVFPIRDAVGDGRLLLLKRAP